MKKYSISLFAILAIVFAAASAFTTSSNSQELLVNKIYYNVDQTTGLNTTAPVSGDLEHYILRDDISNPSAVCEFSETIVCRATFNVSNPAPESPTATNQFVSGTIVLGEFAE